MTPHRRRIVRFALGLIPPFIVAVALYPRILPVYQRTVLLVANAVLAILSPVAEVRAAPSARWQILVHATSTSRPATYTLGIANIGMLAFFQLVAVSALLLATPVRARERLRLFALGVLLMFGLHVLCVAGCAYGMALISDPKSVVFRSLPIVLGPFASGLAVAVWAVLTWRFWLGSFEPEAEGVRSLRRARRS